MAWWSALSLLPDADVVGFAMGVRYGDPWGHRGATHSIAFALAVAAAIAAAAPRLKLPRGRTWWIASAVLISHGLLDTLTDGGLGVALFWPFDLTRYFAPWRPIPVAPIGLAFLSPYGFFVAMTELILFAPLIVFTLRPARLGWRLLLPWSAAVWLIGSHDPVRDGVLGIVLREHTEYARGFSQPAFDAVTVGTADADVRQRVGAPLGVWWDYFREEQSGTDPPPVVCPFVYLEADRVVVEPAAVGRATAMCSQHGIHPGMARAEVERALGSPLGVCWRYSRSPDGRFFRARVVCFAGGKVVAVLRHWERG